MRQWWVLGVIAVVVGTGCSDGRHWQSARDISPAPATSGAAEVDAELKDLGVPLYPKMELPDKMPPAMRTTKSIDIWRSSSDKPEPIADFYEKGLVSSIRAPIKTGFTITGQTKGGNSVIVTVTRGASDSVSLVSISVNRSVAPKP